MSYIAALIATTLCGFALLRFRAFLEPLSVNRDDFSAIQSSHCGEPLRLGGVAIIIGVLLGAWLFWRETGFNTTLWLLLSALPVALAGLAEDMGHRVSPRGRLIAAMVSALLAVALLQMWIARADLPGLDFALTYPVAAISGTILFSAGFCHAVNLIDGMNGLSTVTAIASATGIAVIAGGTGEIEIAAFAALLIACLTGFLIMNWPSARLFLGDAGAYTIGHLLVWLSIMLAWRSEAIAVPAMLLILFWPLADVFHSVYRRVMLRKSPFQPDKMHLHHKVRRALDLVVFGYNQRAKSNPTTTAVLLPFIVMPVAMGVFLQNETIAAWIAFLIFLVGFAAAHKVSTWVAIKYRK